MPRPLSISSGARFLDKYRVLANLRRLAERARAAEPGILRIVLFGSLAKDTYSARSDADLLIVLKRSNERFIDRIPRFLPLFLEASVPVEVFPYTVAETETVPLARRALREGLELLDKRVHEGLRRARSRADQPPPTGRGAFCRSSSSNAGAGTGRLK